MKKFTTILCSIAFAVFGIGLAIFGVDSKTISHAQLANAGTVTRYEIPKSNIIPVFNSQDLPLDIRLGQVDDASTDVKLTKSVDSSKIDSLQKRIKVLERRKQVTKVKWRTAPAPPPVVKEKVLKVTDTIRVPVYYMATQIGNKEGPTDTKQCLPVYEMKQVGEICTDNTNSSIRHVNERDDK